MNAPTPQASRFEPLDEVISILHTKGGAGKSSLTTNMAFELARLGYKILVIDLDRQTGQSVGFGLGSVTFTDRGPGSDIGSVLRGDRPLTEAIIENIYPGLDFLPAEESSLIQAERHLADLGPEGTVRLFEILHGSEKRWDVVFLDTPGRKTEILEVALAASTGVLIPAIPEGGPVSELASVLRHVAKARELYGSVDVYGIVRMRVGGNSRYRRVAEEQTKEVAAGFGAPVLKNKVPEDAKFGEAHLAREPIGAYAESARSAIAYKFIAAELVALRGWPSRLAKDLVEQTSATPEPLSTETAAAVAQDLNGQAPERLSSLPIATPGSPGSGQVLGSPGSGQILGSPGSGEVLGSPGSGQILGSPEAASAPFPPTATTTIEFIVDPVAPVPPAIRPPARPAPRHAKRSAA